MCGSIFRTVPACHPRVSALLISPRAEIWDALKAAAGAEDMATARLIIETAGIIVAGNDHRGSTFYDERGARCFCSLDFPMLEMLRCQCYSLPHSVLVHTACLTGAKYELPPYTLANPINMKPG